MADKRQFQIDEELKLAQEASHNKDSRLIAFVQLLARHAAEADFKAAQSYQNFQKNQDKLK